MRNEKLPSLNFQILKFWVAFKIPSFWRFGPRCYAPFIVKQIGGGQKAQI